MNLHFKKYHGSGNDFLLLDEEKIEKIFTDHDRKHLTILLCDRAKGIGADGILFISNSDVALAKMRVFNADGTEASMCGNGLRCAARYISEITGKDQFTVETMKAVLEVNKEASIFENIPTFRVEISPVLFSPSALPFYTEETEVINQPIDALDDSLLFTAIAVPNPHLITFANDEVLQSDKQKVLSEYVNGPNPIFPDGVNVSFVKKLDKQAIYVRTFERGVGFTNACGTAMSASSLVSCLIENFTFEEPIEVYNNGGKVRCVVHRKEDTFSIDLIGNATHQFNCDVDINNTYQAYTIVSKVDSNEEQIYSRLQQDVQNYLQSH